VNGFDRGLPVGGKGAGRVCLIDRPGGFLRDTADDLREEKEDEAVDVEGSEGRVGMGLEVDDARGVDRGESDIAGIGDHTCKIDQGKVFSSAMS
jgi:hypothetical protein